MIDHYKEMIRSCHGDWCEWFAANRGYNYGIANEGLRGMTEEELKAAEPPPEMLAPHIPTLEDIQGLRNIYQYGELDFTTHYLPPKPWWEQVMDWWRNLPFREWL